MGLFDGETELPLPEKFLENKTVGFNFSPLVLLKNTKSKAAAFLLIESYFRNYRFNIALVPTLSKNQ